MKRKTMFTVIVIVVIIAASLALGIYLCTQFPKMTKPSWLKLGTYMTYEQFFAWTGHNETEYMTWNITNLKDDSADLRLTSHGINVTDGDVVITSGEGNWAINTLTREIVESSDPNYIGKKNPFWIETNVIIGSTVDTLYGAIDISKSESINVLEQQRDCWVIEYGWQTATMKRWYDKASGIALKIQVVLHRQDITIEITETAVQTNADLEL